jgi:2-succinyl-6-hydroxy-2,4-cyclohexadiene-1-carboxylate synthase
LLEKDHPWQAAVIVSANPGLEHEAERAQRRARDTEWATQALTGNWQQFLSTWNAQAVLGNAALRDPGASGSLMQRRREVARSFVDWSLGAQEPLWHRLGEISVPVLWVAGETDLKFRALAERAVANMPAARLVIAPSSGHRVPWDADAWFAGQVSHFLKLGRV